MNIPLRHLVNAQKDKRQFELLSVAVLFKINHSNSIVGKVDNKMLRKEIHCKHNVAQRILEGMLDSALFDINPKNGIVFVPTFKSQTVRTYGCKKKYYGTADFCVKIDIKRYTLREIKRTLRELLLEYTVKATQEKRIERLGGTEVSLDKKGVTLVRDFALTLNQLSSSFGLSKSSAGRYMKSLVDDGRVSKTPIVAECVIPELNDVTASEWMRKNPKKTFHAWHSNSGWSGWLFYGCVYDLVDRNECERFMHIIWNHKFRVNAIVEQTKGSMPDGEGYWAKHC